MFDEAAGIVKYKKRKAAAEKNLAEEQQNLVRIEDILSELDKQVGPLAEQSEKAKEYLGYRDNLKNLDINLFLADYDRIHKEMREVEAKKRIASADLDGANKELEQTKEEYDEVEKKLESLNRSLEQQKELLTSDRLALNQAEGNIKLLNEQILTVRQSKEHTEELLASIQVRMDEANTEKEGYLLQKKEADDKHSLLISNQEALQKKLEEVEKKESSMEEEMSVCNQDMLQYLNANTEVKTDEQRLTTLLEQNAIKKAEITKRILENKSEAAVLLETLEEEKKVLDDVSDKIKAMDDSIVELRRTGTSYEKEEEELRKEHRDTQQKYHMENSRLESLRNLTERYEGYGQSIKRIMEQKKTHSGIVGVVADIIRVKKEYEVAVETALGGSIQNIVTDNEKTAKDMIAFLKKNKYGRATFLPLTNMNAKPMNISGNIMNEPGVIGMASSLVDADDKFDALVQYLLGRFVVVDHIDNGIALARKYHHTIRIVTTEGDLLNPGGSMSGGAFKNNHNLRGRRREMEDLEKHVSKLKEKWQTLSEDIRKLSVKKSEIAEEIAKNNKIRQELRLQQNTAKLGYDRAKADMDKNEEKLDIIRAESLQIEEQKTSLSADIDKIKEKMHSNEMMSKEREDRIAELTKEIEDIKKEKERLAKDNSGLLLEIAAHSQANQFVEENLSRVNKTIEGLLEERAQTDASGENAEIQVKEKENEIQKTKDEIADIKRHIGELEESIVSITQERESLSEMHKGFFDKREELSNHRNKLDQECFRLNNQLEKCQEQLDAKTNYMWEQYELTYHGAEEAKLETDLSPAQMKSRITELKNKMKALGDVNINAIDQYQEVKDRYEHLHTQHDDLIEAANVLIGIIEELDEEMRKQFEEQFGEIRVRFDKVFKELFGGGRGTLELTEDEDILEAGIHIVAQPPGKKLQNMMQLSGGEKALTAIALLFAIQSLKPSPFCLLDEIEAALDDSNVTRYADYLHKLTKDTQFIVITHRRGTMNAADILYGITMQEKGVSTLVSVNLLDEKEIAE